jgi:hypothetical protein
MGKIKPIKNRQTDEGFNLGFTRMRHAIAAKVSTIASCSRIEKQRPKDNPLSTIQMFWRFSTS